MTERIHAFVVRPVTNRAGPAIGVLAGFGVGALVYAWTVLALYGLFGTRPGAWMGLACWAGMHAVCVLAERRWDALGRLPGAVATQLLVALAWVPLAAFPYGSLGTILRSYARLVGIR